MAVEFSPRGFSWEASLGEGLQLTLHGRRVVDHFWFRSANSFANGAEKSPLAAIITSVATQYATAVNVSTQWMPSDCFHIPPSGELQNVEAMVLMNSPDPKAEP